MERYIYWMSMKLCNHFTWHSQMDALNLLVGSPASRNFYEPNVLYSTKHKNGVKMRQRRKTWAGLQLSRPVSMPTDAYFIKFCDIYEDETVVGLFLKHRMNAVFKWFTWTSSGFELQRILFPCNGFYQIIKRFLFCEKLGEIRILGFHHAFNLAWCSPNYWIVCFLP